LTWSTPADIIYGTALGATQLNATASVAGTLVYTPPSGTLLSAGTAQPLSVAFTPTDAANYTTASKTVSINVLKATPVITWTTPASVVLNAGPAQTLSVTFTPTDAANYTAASKAVSINVLKATPVLTWTTPADIIYGTALGATQLNATASVPGTLVYTPPASTVLSAGTAQTPSVSFTPTDSANYTTASKTVSINVLKATPAITWPTPADI